MSEVTLPAVLSGPWVQAFAFEIPIAIKSKSNFRRSGTANWKSFNSFESDVKLLARMARPSDWSLGEKEKALATRPVVVNFIYAVSSLDTANLSKSLLDGCEGVVFHNDASVRGVSAVSDRSSKSSRGLVGFARLDPTASRSDILVALNQLSVEVEALLG